MFKNSLKALSGLAVVTFATFGVAANAQLLGSTLSWQYYFNGSANTGPNPFVVTGGSGGNFQGYFDILAGNTFIAFDYSNLASPTSWSPSGLSLAPTIFNGIAVNVISGPTLTSVSIDPSTNLVGFDNTRFSFTGNQLQVDWAGLSFNNRTLVKFNVNSSSASVPEPGSLALLSGIAVTGVGFIINRRRRIR